MKPTKGKSDDINPYFVAFFMVSNSILELFLRSLNLEEAEKFVPEKEAMIKHKSATPDLLKPVPEVSTDFLTLGGNIF